MRNCNHLLFLLATVLAMITISCEKSDPIIPEPINEAPTASAGEDIILEIPTTSIVLKGTAYDPNGDVEEVGWTKISGPESYFLHLGQSVISPQLSSLEEGIYEFEFFVKDRQDLVAKDTMKLTVFTNLRKHSVSDFKYDPSSLMSVADIPAEVTNNLKWVFVKSDATVQQADNGPSPNIDYAWGGYYYELLPGNKIAINSDGEQAILYY